MNKKALQEFVMQLRKIAAPANTDAAKPATFTNQNQQYNLQALNQSLNSQPFQEEKPSGFWGGVAKVVPFLGAATDTLHEGAVAKMPLLNINFGGGKKSGPPKVSVLPDRASTFIDESNVERQVGDSTGASGGDA